MNVRFQMRRKRIWAASLVLLAAGLTGPAAATESPVEVDISSLSGAYLSARTADAEKDVAAASRFYRAATASDPDNLFLLERSLVLTAASGDVDGAARFASRLAEKAPESRAAQLLLAVEALGDDRPADAVKALSQAGSGALADLTNTLLLGWAKFGLGEVDAALSDIAALDGEDWYATFKRLHRGLISLAAGRTADAVRLLAEARDGDPNAVRITEAYARALAISGEQAKAEKVLVDYLARMPDNSLAARVLEEIRAGNATKGLVNTATEGAAEALSGIGAAVGQEGGIELSALYLRLALHLNPQSAGGLAALSLGNILDGSGQSEAAIEAYETVGADQPFRPLATLRAALALDRADRTEEAEKAFKEAIQRTPEDIQAYLAYGNMLRSHERFDDAAILYGDAIERLKEPGRNDWTLFYFRGIAYERTDRWELAEADFKRALELSPDQPLVLNYLGYSWVDKGINLDEAMAMIRTAVKLRPNDGFIVDSLGWAYYRLGQYKEAVRELERAIELQPDDPILNDHLGDAYWKLGRKLEAQFQWRHARDLGAKAPELEIILRKIADGELVEKASLDSGFYTVQPGDTLWTISADILQSGGAYKRLFNVNRDRLQNPDQLRPGMQLRLPSLMVDAARA